MSYPLKVVTVETVITSTITIEQDGDIEALATDRVSEILLDAMDNLPARIASIKEQKVVQIEDGRAVAPVSFLAWKEQLVAVANENGWTNMTVKDLDEEVWGIYFEAGLTPEAAWTEDMQHAIDFV